MGADSSLKPKRAVSDIDPGQVANASKTGKSGQRVDPGPDAGTAEVLQPVVDRAPMNHEPYATDAAELRDAAEEIAREFPLAIRRTAVVLYDVDPNHLQAQWHVEKDDFVRASNAFPADATGVRPVLRLLRVDAEADERLAAFLPQRPGKAGLEGNARFAVSEHGAQFQVELGLASDDEGWLLLARSNPIRLPSRVRQPIPVRGESAQGAEPDNSRAASADAGAPSQAVAERMPVESKRPWDPTLDEPLRALKREFPNPLQESAWTPQFPFLQVSTALAGLDLTGESTPLPQRTPEWQRSVRVEEQPSWPGLDRASPRDEELPPPLLPSGMRSESRTLDPALPAYNPFSAFSSRSLHEPPRSAPDIEIHAELVVFGRAGPRSVVSIFGNQVQTDADGRFLLRHRLEDTAAWQMVLSGAVGIGPAESNSE